MRADIDFAAHMEAVALALRGPPSSKHGNEWRYGTNGSLSIDIKRGTFFDHENNKGGGVIEFIKSEKPGTDALDYLRGLGCIKPRPGNGANNDPFKGVTLKNNSKQFRIVKTWTYVDETGAELFEVCRLENGDIGADGKVCKNYMQRHKGADGRYIDNIKGIRRVPYKLPRLVEAVASNKLIFITEGEKCVDSIIALGGAATCNPMGAGNWQDEPTSFFNGTDIVILPDNDKPGADHANLVIAKLQGTARRIRILRLPDLPPKGDVADWIAAGGTLARLCELAENSTAAADGPRQNGEWPDPQPLPCGLLPVDEFDPDFLPDAIAPWVMDIADRMQCPPDFVAVPAIVALGSVIGRKVSVRPQRRTDWHEVPNLWGCIVGRPGALKSPAMKEALNPLSRLEIMAADENEAERKNYATRMEFHKLQKEDAQKRVKRGADASLREIEAPEEPKAKRYIVNDTSYEKLGEILSDNPNGVLAYRDELISLLKTLDREEYIAARGFYLSAWSGKDRYTFDRIMRGQTHIKAACVSMLGSVQPGKLAGYLQSAMSGDAGDDGLIQRFGLLVWPNQSPEWREADRYALAEPKAVAWKTFERLNNLTAEAAGAQFDEEYEKIPFLRFDEPAREIFAEWRGDLERRLRAGDMMTGLESHLAKYRKLVPALALINHLADDGLGPINETAVLRALAFAGYLETHAGRAYGAGADHEVAAAQAILKHIRRGDLKDGFTGRDVHQACWANLSDRRQVQAGLDLLAERYWLRGRPLQTGGRPTVAYQINPKCEPH